jgi:hypothetical protein
MYNVLTIECVINGTKKSLSGCKKLTDMKQFEIFISVHRKEVSKLFNYRTVCLSVCPSIERLNHVTF